MDGFGNYTIQDDSNIPSLLSLSYMKFVDRKDPIYQKTREIILSTKNPWYFVSQNQKIKGIGSSHTGNGSIWPLALMMQILTSNSTSGIKNCLESLKEQAVHDLMH